VIAFQAGARFRESGRACSTGHGEHGLQTPESLQSQVVQTRTKVLASRACRIVVQIRGSGKYGWIAHVKTARSAPGHFVAVGTTIAGRPPHRTVRARAATGA
jgi:hypothetical protein